VLAFVSCSTDHQSTMVDSRMMGSLHYARHDPKLKEKKGTAPWGLFQRRETEAEAVSGET
jgi:hypothetical protein